VSTSARERCQRLAHARTSRSRWEVGAGIRAMPMVPAGLDSPLEMGSERGDRRRRAADPGRDRDRGSASLLRAAGARIEPRALLAKPLPALVLAGGSGRATTGPARPAGVDGARASRRSATGCSRPAASSPGWSPSSRARRLRGRVRSSDERASARAAWGLSCCGPHRPFGLLRPGLWRHEGSRSPSTSA
jgi:hypothetical protein